jgi:glucokinase
MILLNDFESCAYSLPNLTSDSFVPLVKDEPGFNLHKETFRCLLIGPGTGYGMSLVYKS